MRSSILSCEEIETFRRYVERKHAEAPAWRRASILADALERAVDGRLPALPDEPRRRLRRKLLERGPGVAAIGADDVLQECLSLDLGQDALLRPIVAWSRDRLRPAETDEREIEAALLRMYRDAPASVGLEALGREADRRRLDEGAQTRGGSRRRLDAAAAAAAGLLLLAGALGLPSAIGSGVASAPSPAAEPPAQAADAPLASDAPVIAEYGYAPVDEERLKTYLRGRDSMLADDPYFGAIVAAAERHDVHPLLLFAITGQEQSFVPASHERAEAIASNPFNVYGSWEDYRTDIGDAATLAARLVAKRLADRPGDVDPIQWINSSYAEDPNWWKGVSWFFEDMKKHNERYTR